MRDRSEEDRLCATIQVHHLGIGETVSFRCPHCEKEVVLEIRERKPGTDWDTLAIHWGKSTEEIEDKKRKEETE